MFLIKTPSLESPQWWSLKFSLRKFLILKLRLTWFVHCTIDDVIL